MGALFRCSFHCVVSIPPCLRAWYKQHGDDPLPSDFSCCMALPEAFLQGTPTQLPTPHPASLHYSYTYSTFSNLLNSSSTTPHSHVLHTSTPPTSTPHLNLNSYTYSTPQLILHLHLLHHPLWVYVYPPLCECVCVHVCACMSVCVCVRAFVCVRV